MARIIYDCCIIFSVITFFFFTTYAAAVATAAVNLAATANVCITEIFAAIAGGSSSS